MPTMPPAPLQRTPVGAAELGRAFALWPRSRHGPCGARPAPSLHRADATAHRSQALRAVPRELPAAGIEPAACWQALRGNLLRKFT